MDRQKQSPSQEAIINNHMRTVLVTGGFDPLHSGHLSYFESAKSLGDRLIVGVNSDAWLARKKGRSFMPSSERTALVDALSVVDQAVAFDNDYDRDNSCCRFIEDCLANFPDDEIVFANGGDRTKINIPEMTVENSRLSFCFGIGGEDKKNSSSWILEEWKSPKTQRQWGYYRVLHEAPGVKVKELTVDPGESLSMQRHFHRSEYWLVSTGIATVEYQRDPKWNTTVTSNFSQHQELHIPVGSWHQLRNNTQEPVQIIEIQYGTECIEEDIERR